LDLNGKRVLVVGLGRSGIAAAVLCAARGARVTVTDKRDAAVLAPALAALPPEVLREVGGHRQATFTGAELIVLSPGVPEIPELAAARAAGVAITGEMELASRFVSSTLIAITGTNGSAATWASRWGKPSGPRPATRAASASSRRPASSWRPWRPSGRASPCS
jgi:UDP-N-acetylmuramoylalanine--D-glutamate ligase